MPINQTAKQIAVSAAKKAAYESNEILKTAGQQILSSPETSQQKPQPEEQKTVTPQKEAEARKEASLKNMMRSYEGELNQIKRDNLFKELQRKISEGIEVPLEDFANELSSEQKDVLKAQIEATLSQQSSQNSQKRESIPQIISKKGRQMVNKIKKQNEMHVETRQPPSS